MLQTAHNVLNYHELYRTKGQQNKRAYGHEKNIDK